VVIAAAPVDGADRPRLALVLGSGGVRGIAHLGILRRLIREGVRPDALVGCSAGALIAAFYAAAGIDAEELVRYGTSITARHLLAYGLVLRRFPRVWKSARERCEWITDRLSLLDTCDVDRLAFGVKRLGLLTFDLVSRREIFVATGRDNAPLTLGDAVRGSAAVPLLFPSRRIERGGLRMKLIDGGVSRTLPLDQAFEAPIAARGVLAVSLPGLPGFRERSPGHFRSLREKYGERLILLEPPIPRVKSLFYSEADNASLVEAGERALTPEILGRIRGWL
jgi:NTE family protein